MEYFTDEIKCIIDKLIKDYNYSGTVCITHEGQKVFEGAYGWADKENNILNTRDTTFYIASVTKQFTSASIMLLYERKLLDIDETLDRYLPEYKHASMITLRQLMNMTSGIPDYINDVIDGIVDEERKKSILSPREFEIFFIEKWRNRFYSLPDVLALINDIPLKFAPGERYDYSNTNYYLLSSIIEQVSGQTFETFLNENIIQPLGITPFSLGSQYAMAVSYDYVEGELLNEGRGKLNAGDGAIVTTSEDLSIWLNAVLGGRVLSKSSWNQTFEIFQGTYGFGWVKEDFFKPIIWYGHGGSLLGYQSFVYISFEFKIAVAMLANIPTQVKKTKVTDENSPKDLDGNLLLMLNKIMKSNEKN